MTKNSETPDQERSAGASAEPSATPSPRASPSPSAAPSPEPSYWLYKELRWYAEKNEKNRAYMVRTPDNKKLHHWASDGEMEEARKNGTPVYAEPVQAQAQPAPETRADAPKLDYTVIYEIDKARRSVYSQRARDRLDDMEGSYRDGRATPENVLATLAKIGEGETLRRTKNEEITGLNELIDALKDENRELKATINKNNTDRQAEYATLTERHNSLVEQNKGLKERLVKKEEQIAGLQAQARISKGVDRQLSSLQKRYDELQEAPKIVAALRDADKLKRAQANRIKAAERRKRKALVEDIKSTEKRERELLEMKANCGADVKMLNALNPNWQRDMDFIQHHKEVMGYTWKPGRAPWRPAETRPRSDSDGEEQREGKNQRNR